MTGAKSLRCDGALVVRALVVVAIMLAGCGSVMAADKQDAEQARLDQACEVAREKKLAPERKALIESCTTTKERPDRASCERFYADYGNQAGRRAPLYMDLPECVKAFDFRHGRK